MTTGNFKHAFPAIAFLFLVCFISTTQANQAKEINSFISKVHQLGLNGNLLRGEKNKPAYQAEHGTADSGKKTKQLCTESAEI
jgi:dolichyl-phosphate-mannose--protein O-mannosyl transferase